MKTVIKTVAVVLTCLLTGVVASASLVFSTFDGVNVSSSGCPVQYFNNAGDQWSATLGYTAQDIWELTYAEINIELLMGASSDLHVYLYEGLSPETQVAELYPSTPVGAQANYSFYPSETVYLTPNTFYSLVVAPGPVEGTWFTWHYAPDYYGGVDTSHAEGTTWGPWENVMAESPAVSVYGEIVPAPEPATIALFGLGGLLCFWRMKRQTGRIRCPGTY